MKSTSQSLRTVRRAVLPGVAVLALALSGCGQENSNSSTDDPTSPSAGTSDTAGTETTPAEPAGELSGTLDGAGATSQEKAQEAWSIGFQGLNPDVTVSYNAVGSGDGRKQFIAGGVQFAGSDSALSDDEGELTAAKKTCGGEDPIEVPAYVSPIAVIFNLPDFTELDLDAPTIAQIFNGKITKWNDDAIAALNPDADLPDTTISPVHRQDDSGTTKNFTDYLGKVAPDDWTYEAEDAFPVQGGLAADGTSGVVAAVTNGEGTIGYADESQAGDLGQISVKVGEDFVAPSAEGAALAFAASPRTEGRPAVDMATDIDRATTEAGAYPVLLASYLIACQTYADADEAALVKGYLGYIVSSEGQQAAAEGAGSAPLSQEISDEAAGIVGAIAAK